MSSKRAGTAVAALVLLSAAASAGPDLVVVNPASAYPEGPVAVDGVLYYAEMGADRVMRFDGKTNAPVWSRPGCGPTSVARGADATLVVLCHREQAIARVGPSGETITVIVLDSDGRPFVTPNATINDGKGGVYLSSSGTFSPTSPAEGAVLYLDARGGVHRLAEGIHYANGVALSADGKALYVSEHLSRQVLAYDVADDGSLFGKRVFLRLDDAVGADPKREWDVGPDGLAMDKAGHLYIAEYGGGRIIIVDKTARLMAIVPIPEQYVTAPVLIDGEKRLFVTAPVSFDDPRAMGKVYTVANPVYGKN